MDPNCTLGFYCRDRADFEMFCAQVNGISISNFKNRFKDCSVIAVLMLHLYT